ncbi:putative acyltransferase [Anabaenopsis circularis NIES-21]|uniref:Putative acyltransferase n=1 Tax=Anabaenopsis circularis NIES-21 TaxID=1085406 RepID=A0A1Z4GNG5_9CYAN|nr:putative acyltransferase [Anabaenopsis circularis NIES-21]
MSEKIKDRFLELDVLRGIAAFSVVLFHYTSQYSTLFKHSLDLHFHFGYGRHGVELFFIISGFVILMTLENAKRGRDFIVGRLSRLYPAYWFAIILTFSVIQVSKLPVKDVSFFEALFNLTMLQGFFNIPNVDGVYWTLKVELCFYLLMFIIYKLGQLKNISLITFGWLSLTSLYTIKIYIARWFSFAGLNVNTNYLIDESHNLSTLFPKHQLMVINLVGNLSQFGVNINTIKDIWRDIFILGYAHLFILGITLFLIKQKGLSFGRCMMLLVCILTQRVAYPWENSWNTTIFVAAFVGIFYLAIQGYLRCIRIKPLIFLGNISYSLYLIHQYIGYAIIRTLYSYKLNPNISIIITIICSIALATLISKFIEYPAMIFIRNKYKNKILPKLANGN